MLSDVELFGSQPDDPAQGTLFDELKLARRYGLSNPNRPLPKLLYVARIVSSESEDADKMKDAITKGIERLGGKEPEVLMALMGFTKATQGLPVEDRRTIAAELNDYTERERFRKDIELPLLRAVATNLTVLIAEQRMADQRAEANAASDPESPAAEVETQPQPNLDPPLGKPPVPPHPETSVPSAQPEPPSVLPPNSPAKWRTAAIGGVLLAAVALIVSLALEQDRGASAGSCGSTTAQLFDPASSEALYAFAPHQEGAQEGWTASFLDPLAEPKHKEVFRFGESRLFALSYRNTSANTEHSIIARVGLPQGAILLPDSACLYTHHNYSSGRRYEVSPLLLQTGLKIGSVAPAESVYLTFKEQLPAKTPYINLVRLYGRIGPEAEVAEPEWMREHQYLELELTK